MWWDDALFSETETYNDTYVSVSQFIYISAPHLEGWHRSDDKLPDSVQNKENRSNLLENDLCTDMLN